MLDGDEKGQGDSRPREVKVKSLSLSDSLRPRGLQVPLSVEFSRQEYWSGLPFLSLVDLPDPRIEPRSPASQADSLLSEPLGNPVFEGKF